MNPYHFTLVISGAAKLTVSMANALYSAGCDDATPGMCDGRLVIDFHRQSSSLEEAIRTAIADVRSAGYDAARVEMDVVAVGSAA